VFFQLYFVLTGLRLVGVIALQFAAGELKQGLDQYPSHLGFADCTG
jgi:hypothetical protein